MDSRENCDIIRKLGKSEYFYAFIERETFSFEFDVCSKIDLFKHLDQLKQAIVELKLLHPLLRAKIAKTSTDINDLDAYFVADSSNSLENVKFYVVKSNQEFNLDTISNLLIQNESANPIDCFSSNLLWRLTFIQSSESNLNFKLIASFSHAIIDARNGYWIILQLLESIESIHNQRFKRKDSINVLPCTEFLFDKSDQISQHEIIKIPSFFRNQILDKKLITAESFADIRLELNDSNELVDLNKLIKSANRSISQYRKHVFTETQFKAVQMLCKKENVTITTFLNLLFAISMERVYEKYQEPHDRARNHDIVLYDSINLRQFDDAFANRQNEDMGCYINSIYIKYDDLKLSEIDSNDKFWRLAKSDAAKFKKRVEEEKFNKFDAYKTKTDEIVADFILTNLGVMPSSIGSSSQIKLNQVFGLSSFSRFNRPRFFLFNFCATIDYKFCWTLIYNSNYVQADLVDFYMKSTIDLFDKLRNN